jgi:hypothetical protein
MTPDNKGNNNNPQGNNQYSERNRGAQDGRQSGSGNSGRGFAAMNPDKQHDGERAPASRQNEADIRQSDDSQASDGSGRQSQGGGSPRSGSNQSHTNHQRDSGSDRDR